MYNVLDVCRYVINYSNEQEYGISNLKLQKILYFIQAFFIICKINNEPCFYEKIEAWDFGPVVPEAYQEYKRYGSGNIPTVDFYTQLNEEDIWDSEVVNYDDSIIKDSDKNLINQVINKFADYSATNLVSITHNQNPWKDAYKKGENNEITTEAIKEYFYI